MQPLGQRPNFVGGGAGAVPDDDRRSYRAGDQIGRRRKRVLVGTDLPVGQPTLGDRGGCVARLGLHLVRQHFPGVAFGLEAFVFGALFRNGEREHYRYLVGCKPEWCFLYNQSKWYAIDPFIDYALHHTSPVLASEVPLSSLSFERDSPDLLMSPVRDVSERLLSLSLLVLPHSIRISP